jgi:hypothetical protein
MMDLECTKVVMNVIKNSPNKKMTKLSMMMTQDKDQKGKCFLCGNKNKLKKFWYYDASKSLDENKKNAAEKNNEKEE